MSPIVRGWKKNIVRDSHGNVRSVTLGVHRDSQLRIFSPFRWPFQNGGPQTRTIPSRLRKFRPTWDPFEKTWKCPVSQWTVDRFHHSFFGAYPNLWDHNLTMLPSKFPPASPSTAWVLYKNSLYKNLRGSVPRWAIYFQLYQTHSTLRIWGTLESDCQILKLLLKRDPLYWRLRN